MMRSCLAFTLLLLGPIGTAGAAGPVEFLRDVRPILSGHCFKCHGPDGNQRQAGFRLDVREAAIGETDSGARAIVPGKPDESELVRRIFATDEFEVMPPPETKNPLTAEQQRILREWIAAGAGYQPHWAFLPVERPPVPEAGRSEWPRTPVDRFVLARLDSEGLPPSPEADRYTLARRVHLDLVGLPPTPGEVDEFVHDASPAAYEKLVDRLLASPRYGERWARPWLDLARYADTHGYEKDRPRSIWPYRDWVIGALNADMPFDRFTIEQQAGDMLHGATLEQRIATGFHRNTMINEEGGIDPLEFRYYAVVDRINTTATVWLGLTLGCAQCHTHKYDPVPHAEYFRMLAFLNNADEPEIEVPQPESTARREGLLARIAELRADLPSRFPLPDDREVAVRAPRPGEPPAWEPDSAERAARRQRRLERRFNDWLAREREQAVGWTVLSPAEATSNLPKLDILDDGSVLASGDQTKRDVYEVTFAAPLRNVTAVRLEALPHESLPRGGPGRTDYEGPRGDFFLSEFVLAADGRPVRFARASETYAKLGIGGGGSSAALAIDGDPHTGWSTSGREGERHTAVFNLAEPLAAGALSLTMIFERHYAAGLGRFRLSVTSDARDVSARDVPFEIERLLLAPADELADAERDRLREHFLSVAPELASARKEIESLRRELPAYPTTMVLAERPPDHPRPTHRHHRGEFLQPADAVEPGVLSVLHPFPEGVPRNRLSFARWLVDPANPLVGRVTVNRHWAALFGRGLVRTVEDFGFQGELPSHPELLDWLAVEFTSGGGAAGRSPQAWSLKRLHHLLLTSATYRQSSRVTPELLSRDAENVLLARGPRLRLEAELIRDAALAAAGLLSQKVGGPSVFPPQPASVTTEGAYGRIDWKASEGDDRYRRGLYTFAKRTAPFAMFATFDAPSGEACVARREVSNTPLQALTLLNDTVFIEAAQELGRHAAALTDGDGRPASDEARITALFRRCLTRPPESDELRLLTAFYETQKQRFENGELNAAAIAGPGGPGGPGEGPLSERAAWTSIARAILNVDEAINRR